MDYGREDVPPWAVRAEGHALGFGLRERDDREVSERYTPPYATYVGELAHSQHAYFRRGTGGDSALLVIVAGTNGDAGVGMPDSAAGVATYAGAKVYRLSSSTMLPADSSYDARPVSGSRYATSLAVAWDSLVAGVETFTPTTAASLSDVLSGKVRSVMQRTRFVARPPDQPVQRLQTSDILLYDAGGAMPSQLEGAGGALEYALSSSELAGRKVGMFWEVYRPLPGESITFRLSVSRWASDRSSISRVARSLVGRRDTELTQVWTEDAPAVENVAGGLSIWARAMVVGLDHLQPGNYELRLQVDAPGQAPVIAGRTLRVQ